MYRELTEEQIEFNKRLMKVLTKVLYGADLNRIEVIAVMFNQIKEEIVLLEKVNQDLIDEMYKVSLESCTHYFNDLKKAKFI